MILALLRRGSRLISLLLDSNRLGAAIEVHAMFPNRINVEFVQVLSSDHARVKVRHQHSIFAFSVFRSSSTCFFAGLGARSWPHAGLRDGRLRGACGGRADGQARQELYRQLAGRRSDDRVAGLVGQREDDRPGARGVLGHDDSDFIIVVSVNNNVTKKQAIPSLCNVWFFSLSPFPLPSPIKFLVLPGSN